MSVEETKHGTWQARWRDPDGKQRAKTFRRKIDAERFERKTRGDIDHGTYVDPKASGLTVKAMADEWLTGAMNLKAGGRETYERDLGRYILPKLGSVRLRSLNKEAVDRFLADELASGLAASTVHRHYRTLRRMLQVAVDNGRLPRNPCEKVTPPHVPRAEMRFLTVEEVDALAAAIGERYRAWVYVAAYNGLRWAETVGLRREHVDGSKVTVAGQLVRRADGTFDWREPKTAAGVRTVTSPKFVTAILAAHLEKFGQPGPKGLVFSNGAGNPMIGPSFTGNVFKPALKRAELDPKVRIHDLRHTAVALAIAAGAHPKAIQVRMGHASIAVTLDRYGHLYPTTDEAVASGLEALKSPPSS